MLVTVIKFIKCPKIRANIKIFLVKSLPVTLVVVKSVTYKQATMTLPRLCSLRLLATLPS